MKITINESEEKFANSDFFRASKSTIINLSKIKVITPVFGGRIEVILENDEKYIFFSYMADGSNININGNNAVCNLYN